MKTKTFLIIFFLVFTTLNGCERDTSTICDKLLEQGNAGQSLLKGEWKFESFAYTLNGSTIKYKEKIQKGTLAFNDTMMGVSHTNTIRFLYTLEGKNNIMIKMKGSTYINPPQEENDITVALINSLCYVIKENKLLIHFTEKDKKNILILTKK